MAPLPDVMPTMTEQMLFEGSPSLAPHIAIRGTGIPSTTRCEGLYPLELPSYVPDSAETLRYIQNYFCFVDVRVSEYIIGEGPAELTVAFYRLPVDIYDPENPRYKDKNQMEDWLHEQYKWLLKGYDDFRSLIASLYEGKEMVVLLGVGPGITIETWEPRGYEYSLWYVQRDEDGTRAVSPAIEYAQTAEQRSHLDVALDELIRRIEEGGRNRAAITGGRLGRGTALPMLVTDANQLQDFYRAVGAVYEGENATLLPPPAPGAEEPEQDPTQTGEGGPEPILPGPGEEEPSPPPTDDATTTSTAPAGPRIEDTTTSTGAVPPADGSTTPPQAEDTSSTTTVPAGPGAEDTAPTPTGTTDPPVEATSPDSAGGTTAPVDDDSGGGAGQA